MEDLNKEIETWEEIKPENVGVYLSDKRDSINIDGYSDAIRSRYAYETNVQQMPKSDYVGMVRFNNEKTKRNPLTSAFRGAWSGLLQLPAGVDNAVTGLSEWITNAIYSGDIEAQKEISEAANALRQKNDAWLKEWSYQKDEKDSSFAFDFGQGGGSMFAAIGLSILTRNPNMAATMFGASQYGNLNKELREKGFDINYGNLTALVGGIAEGGLEKFGLHMWFENYASKKIGTFLIKQGATEFVQESSQQAAEEFIMRVSGGRVDGKSFSDVVSEVLYAGALGGMLGFVGGGVSIPSTQAYKGRAQKVLEAGGMSKDEASRYIEAHLYGNEKQQKELQDKVNNTIKDINVKYATLEFKKLGIEGEQAKEFAENMATNPEEVKASLIDLLNKEADFETLQNNSLADDVAYFKEQRKNDIVAEAFDIKEKIKEEAIAAGVSEEDAEVAATLESNFALRMFEETGETPLDYYENKRAKIEVENPFELTEDLVEGELIDESELTEEETARLEAAEKAREQEEDIPFFQESLDVAKENARLDEQYPAYEGETIDINGVQKTVYNSEGERIAKSAEALQNFYKWFGDSKVVDEQGRPKVVYHGTKKAGFRVFDKGKQGSNTGNVDDGFFFGDRSLAKTYTTNYAEVREEDTDIDEYGEQPEFSGMYAVYLKMSDPEIWDFQGASWDGFAYGKYAIYDEQDYMWLEDEDNNHAFRLFDSYQEAESYLEEKGGSYRDGDSVEDRGKETEYTIKKDPQLYDTTRELANEAKLNGMDGLIIKNINDTGGYGFGGEEGSIYVVFDSEQIKSVDNRGTFSKENPDIYYQFAGEKAQTAALDELNRAKQLEADGVDNEQIRQQTGWFKGVDGKWRFEISDKDAEFDARKLSNNGGLAKLGDILKHDKLYEAYPELKNIDVLLDNTLDDGVLGKYVGRRYDPFLSMELGGQIYLKRGVLFDKRYDVKSILLHEIQHIIQEKEKFARGGSSKTIAQEIKDIAESLHYKKLGEFEEISDKANRLADVLEVYRFSEKPERILKSHVLYEHGSPFSMPSKKDKAARKQYINELYDMWWQDMQDKYEDRNDWEFFDLIKQNSDKEIKKEYNALRAKAKRLLNKADTKALRAYEKIVHDIDNGNISSTDAYMRLYGEVEARNTQARMDMSEEERKAATPESTQDVANADAIVIFDDGTAMAYEPETYYQSAFHGSQNKELEGGKFDLKYAGKKTGNVHGYGVYAVVSKPSAEYWAGENGQVYELDVPEDFDLIDEQKPFSEQPEKVRYAILGALEKINGFGFTEKAIENDMPGGEVYVQLGKDVYYDKHGAEGGSTDVMKAASEYLENIGIKGITYNYANEKNFVIFNPADVKVIQKFYQGENNPLGSYMPASRVIHLFKKANRSTLIHELGHHFTMQYVKALEANGRTDKLEGFYNWLGINNISEATTQTWEQMARGFETYVMEGEAPNIDTESLFEKFKRYLIGVYTDLTGKVIKPEEINDDVRAFFDEMIAGTEELPDVRGLEGKLDQIKSAISGALKGEEVNFEGLSTKDLRNLVKLMTMRKPRKPKNLKQKIRAAGGIDIDLAKAIGIYDSKKGNEGGFFKKGGIDREDSLIEFLADAGYLSRTEGEDYEQNAQIYDDAIELIENADNVYTAEEQQKIDERVAIENMAYDAAQKLGDIKTDDIFKAMKVLKKYDMKAVDKNTLKYLNVSIKQVERLAKEAKKELKQDISDKQAQLIDFVKKLPLSYKNQMKIMERLKRAKLADDFENVINQAAELSKEFYLNEKRKMLSGMIDEQVKSSKPKKVTQQKYDYANNKLFKDLRDYSKMTQEQAAEQLSKAQINDDITPEDLVRMHYLNYKANGAKTSTEMLEQVYADIVIAKQQGLAAKDEADFEKSMNREAVRQEIIDAIDANDADKNTLKTRIGNLYRKGLTNLYSLINSISSKKLADAFEMETVLNRAQVKYHKQTEALKEKAFRVYNVKSAGDLLNRFADMGKTIGHLYNVDGIKAEEISVMKLVDIYNAMKNEKTRQDYIDNYGEEQLERLLSYLTPQDIAFADLMMEDINSLFPEVNKTYIKIYGMDLLKVENYWPATSEHTTETSLLGDYYSQQTTPSSWKERVKGKVTPIPQNAWTKYLKHINENIYMINTAEKYKELATVFKSKRIRNKITNKFGAGVYNELMKQISALSLNAKSDSLNYIESAFGSILNNFVVAKIAVAPTVFAGQLTSITNYAGNVKSTTFYKHFAEGLAHPKQTIKFMKEVAGDFLEARYKGGYAESISNVLSEAEDAMSQKFRLISPKTKYNTTNALSSFVRMGDIGAIIFGGYGQIKANLEAGMSMDEAVKRFEFDTLRSQQSSIKASLGSFQQSKGIARMFLAFKNTQHQYFRKIADAVINLQRGEISSKEAAKIIGNYALIQTTLYVMAKNLVNAGLGLLDDDDKITDGVLEQILLGTIDAIPFLSDMLHFAYRRLSGQYSPNLLSMVGIDDIQRSINKFYKQEKNVYDYVEIITPLIEGTTSLPVQRFERMFKKYTEE